MLPRALWFSKARVSQVVGRICVADRIEVGPIVLSSVRGECTNEVLAVHGAMLSKRHVVLSQDVGGIELTCLRILVGSVGGRQRRTG